MTRKPVLSYQYIYSSLSWICDIFIFIRNKKVTRIGKKMMDILDTAGLLNTKWANLVFGADMHNQGQVKENVKIPYVLFSTWKRYAPLLSLPHLASLPCLASSQPASPGDKKQDKTKSWPICPPPPWPQGGNTVLCSNSPFPTSSSQTRTPAFVTIQNRENPWVIPYLVMAVSRENIQHRHIHPRPSLHCGKRRHQ